MPGRHPVYENIPDDPAEMREEIIRLREGEHVRKGEEGKVGLIARALGRAPPGEAPPATRPAGLTITQVVFGGITLSIAVGALVLAFGENRAGQAAAITTLTAQVAELKTLTANLPTFAATVTRLEGATREISAAREAGRADADRLLGEVRGLERQISEATGRLGVQGNALTVLQGTATSVATLRAEVDADRRAAGDRERVQDDRIRSLAEITTGLRDVLIRQGVAPPRRSDAPLDEARNPTTVPAGVRECGDPAALPDLPQSVTMLASP